MSDVFDATAEALTRRVLADLPADRPHGRADLGGLPSPVARLLAARLDAAVERATPVSRWLDTADDRLRAATDAWLDAAREAVHVPASEWAETVREAVRQALAHLVRPAETLAAAAFEGEAGPLPIATALRRLRAFGPYAYLPEIAARYAERKGLDRVDRDGLETLLRRIDRRMVSAFGADDWATLLGPLAEWAGTVGQPSGTVPGALIREALVARDADALADALDGAGALSADALRARLRLALPPPVTSPPVPEPEPTPAPEPDAPEAPPAEPDDTTPTAASPPEEPGDSTPEEEAPTIGSRFRSPEYDGIDESEVLSAPRPVEAPEEQPEEAEPSAMDEVRDALTFPADDLDVPPAPPVPVLDVPGDFAPDAEPAPLATPADALGDEDETPLWQRMMDDPSAPSPTPAAESDDETPLWKRFAQSDLAARLPDASVAPPPPEPSAEADEANEVAGPSASPGLDAVEARVLGPDAHDRRAWYVAALFEGSTAEYHRALDRIGRVDTYTEATHVISEEVFRRHHVSPYTDAAVAFIDAVQDRFEAG